MPQKLLKQTGVRPPLCWAQNQLVMKHEPENAHDVSCHVRKPLRHVVTSRHPWKQVSRVRSPKLQFGAGLANKLKTKGGRRFRGPQIPSSGTYKSGRLEQRRRLKRILSSRGKRNRKSKKTEGSCKVDVKECLKPQTVVSLDRAGTNLYVKYLRKEYMCIRYQKTAEQVLSVRFSLWYSASRNTSLQRLIMGLA